MPGVMMIRDFPHGFYEFEMFSYFRQFGYINKLRLVRSRKTLRSKAIAFIEFAEEEVAKITAETMNNYLMFDCLIKSEFIPMDKVHPRMFKRWNLKRASTVVIHKRKCNSIKTDEKDILSKKRKLKSIRKNEAKLLQHGIDFKCQIINNVFNRDASSRSLLVVDSSDEDIQFKTPPNTRKIKKIKKPDHIPVITLKPTISSTKKRTKFRLQPITPKFELLRAAVHSKRMF